MNRRGAIGVGAAGFDGRSDGMKYPAEVYSASPRPYQGLGELEYPLHDRTIMVTTCGRICIGKRKVN